MTEYGQSIPNRVLQMSNINGVSKANFAHIFCQGLAQIGMQFIGQLSGYDVLDPANAEHGIVQGGPGSNPGIFMFDFPTTDYYVVGTTKYRPCIAVSAPVFDYQPGWYGDTNDNAFKVQLMRRRWDRVLMSDLRSYYFYRINGNPAIFGIGAPRDGSGQGFFPGAAMKYPNGGYYDNQDPRWLPFVGATGGGGPNPYYLRNFSNLYMYLGTGGLHISLGSDTSKTGFGSWMSYTAAFAGGRIPGRALIPDQDVNLPRIFPVLDLPMHAGVHNDFYDGTSLRANIYGMQFNLKQRADNDVVATIANLENVEQPIFPSYVPQLLRSPRIVNGNGAYVLARPVIIPRYEITNGADFMGPIDTQITTADVRPQWEDLFTCPNFRFGDRTVTPHVEYVDPVDSKHWFIVYAKNTNMAYAFDYTAKTLMSGITVSKQLVGSVSIDLSVGGFSGPFPPEVVSMVATNPSNQPPPWTPVPATNEARVTVTNAVTFTNKDILVTLQPGSGDAVSTVYEFQVDLKLACTQTGSPTGSYLQLFIFDQSNNAVLVQQLTSTTNPASPNQNYVTFKFFLPAISSLSGHMVVLLRYHNDGNQDTFVAGVRNMIVNKYAYAP